MKVIYQNTEQIQTPLSGLRKKRCVQIMHVSSQIDFARVSFDRSNASIGNGAARPTIYIYSYATPHPLRFAKPPSQFVRARPNRRRRHDDSRKMRRISRTKVRGRGQISACFSSPPSHSRSISALSHATPTTFYVVRPHGTLI